MKNLIIQAINDSGKVMKNLIIQAINDSGKVMYWSTDYECSGYPYWSEDIRRADLLTIEEIEDRLKSSFMIQNGVYPPLMLAAGIGLSYKKPTGSLEISVCKIEPILVKKMGQYYYLNHASASPR